MGLAATYSRFIGTRKRGSCRGSMPADGRRRLRASNTCGKKASAACRRAGFNRLRCQDAWMDGTNCTGSLAAYRGGICSDRLGGTMAGADLSEFASEWVEPISTDYHGWKVYELPPNGQGMATLEMLNIMEGFPLAAAGAMSTDTFHIKMEAQKLAYADLQ